MSRNEFKLLHLLAEKVGIRTATQLEEFKKKTKATNNEILLKRLALCVACDMTIDEVIEHK